MPPTHPDLVARAVETEAEIVAYHETMIAAFSSGSQIDLKSAAERERRDYEAVSDFQPQQRRGVFRGDAYLGGCIVWERVMRVGPARLRTGCIGGVHTDQNHRNQGVASACMNDAIAFAKAQGYALLLLDGIPNFYHRFGYADVLDLTDQAIDRVGVQTSEGTATSTRPATIEDAPTLLALFERHFGRYTGSFERSLGQQEARLARGLDANNPPILAVDENGTIRGYLQLRRRSRKERAIEVAADTWPAALALLRYHEQMVASLPDPPSELRWPLPPGALTLLLLADNLTSPGRWDHDQGARGTVIRAETYQRRSSGWLARLVSLPRVAEGLLPVWRERLARASAGWPGTFRLQVGEESCAVEVLGTNIRLLPEAPAGAPIATFTPDQIVQAVFGYRPLSYLASSPGASVPDALVPTLNVLFPTGQACIPGSDGF